MLERQNKVIDILYCGEYNYAPDFSASAYISESAEFVFVDAGSAAFSVDGKSYVLNKGEILITGRGKLITQMPTGEGARVVMEAFEGELLPVFEQAVFRLNASQLMHIENIKKLSGDTELGKKKEKAKVLVALYTEILMTVLSDMPVINESVLYNTPSAEAFGKIYDCILKFSDEKLTLTAISEKAGMSEPNIKKLVRACAGCGVSALVSKIKLIKAKKLLDSGMRAKDAANKLGFDNEAYFSSFFKREAGMSLREYKGLKRK